MGKIPANLESIGSSEVSSISIDVDSIVRDAMVKLFSLTDENGSPLGNDDDAINDMREIGFSASKDDSGASALIDGFARTEINIMSFFFQQILAFTYPIKTALELPPLLKKPPKLAKKVKTIIKMITDLIKDVMEVITNTEQWFIGLALPSIAEINIPIPELTISLLGIDIVIPEIDINSKFDTDMFKENLLGKIPDLPEMKIEMGILNDAVRMAKKLNDPQFQELASLVIGITTMAISALTMPYIEESKEFYDLVIDLHKQILYKQEYIVYITRLYKKNKYVTLNNISVLKGIKSELENTETKDSVSRYLGDIDELLEIPDKLLEVVDDEEETLMAYVVDKGLNNKKIVKDRFAEIDKEINKILDKINEKKIELKETKDLIAENQENNKIVNNMLTALSGAAVAEIISELEISEKLNELKDELITDSPVTVWMQQMLKTIIGVVETPIKFIIDLIKLVLESIQEFVGQLPVPTFAKTRELFEDVISLSDLESMREMITTKILETLSLTDEQLKTAQVVLDNVMKFLPELITNIGIEFVKAFANPLPL